MDKKSINRFIKLFSREIKESNAAIFAGAGLSKPAGFVDWKELMRDIADDLSLDIDKETDLIAIAQYHVNEFSRNRINQTLIDEFVKDSEITENHRILTRLPLSTFWTTNYDNLIERALEQNKKRPDVKRTVQDLAIKRKNSDAAVYKMHGDITMPHEAVLTKDDYEGYNLKRELFTTTLKGDLVSKTFLFLGFSFDDPNLSFILGRIRSLLGENQRHHYCLMKKVQRKDCKSDEEFIYDEVKQKLKVNDLKRYCIEVLLIDSYDDITTILGTIENQLKRSNIFISGSAATYAPWQEDQAFQLATLLSKKIINKGWNIVSGFGLGIGSCVISGALEELYLSSRGKVEERLKLRPFPQQTTGKLSLSELWTRYREDMLSNVGIGIFLFGNKIDKASGNIIEANGMIEEFEIAKKQGVIPIPIGATGYTSRKLWDEIINNFEKYVPDSSLKPLYLELEKEMNIEALTNTVIKIIETLAKTGGEL